jgi:hypothetical protein
MTDPRAVLDAYASEGAAWDEDGQKVSCYLCAPNMHSALRAVLDLHPPSTLNAGVLPERFGPGKCAYCHLGTPTRQYRGKYADHRPETDMHEHIDPEPFCFTCHGGGYGSSAPWPCPTVEAITAALEGK